MKRFLLISNFLMFIIPFAFSQTVISGKLIDAGNRKPLPGVHIILSDSQTGTVSNAEGQFLITTNHDKGWLRFRAMGYKTSALPYKIKGTENNLGTIPLQREAINLNEITVSAGLVKDAETPVTVSTVSARTIHNELGDRSLPFSLNHIPGVYTVRAGGGSGDAGMSIRGFDQANVAVLLDGVPINGVENGSVYWSNWLGLASAAAEIQVQKGPGFANAAVNSVGGSVNIITEPASKTSGGSVSYQVTSYGNRLALLTLNSGKMKNGWSISMMGSYSTGPGYIDATYVRGWSYYLALSKQINKKNKLTLTLLGAPQRHGQRTLKLSDKEYLAHGNLYNKDWGSYNGKINNASENFYHRPFLGINHYLTLDKNKKLATSIYLILGSGGGKWSESFNYAPSIFSYRNESGQIDWPAIYHNNATHPGQYVLNTGDTVSGYSMNVQTHFLASHIETGLLSTYQQQINDHFKFVAGIHYRYFNSFLREQIIDLLGGKFYIDDYAWAVDGDAGRNEVKTVGDIIKVNNNSIINFINAYAQMLYSGNSFNAYLSVNGNNNWYQRVDRYNYVTDTKSATIILPGFDVRGGISFQPAGQHIVYANGAFISKAPYFKYVFGNFNNRPVINLKNEQISTVEAGYRFKSPKWVLNLSAYYTLWSNVSLLSDEYVQLESNLQTRALINGLNAVHQGIELEAKANLSRNFKLGAFMTLGDYRWKNNVEATLFNNENIAVDTIYVYVKNIYVGGTAQQQFGLNTEFRLLNFFNVRAEWVYFNKIFAGFSPTIRRNSEDTDQPYQIPGYQTLNVYISIPFKFFKTPGLVQINGFNLLNSNFIEWGEDGANHQLNTFRGFWSFGRTFDFMLRLYF
ncbi:MAG TPA: TonB-dependent receptor [Bacteroidetes bacterium]|nr:TonB-dependent receptor [Bacteroidota bacterium]